MEKFVWCSQRIDLFILQVKFKEPAKWIIVTKVPVAAILVLNVSTDIIYITVVATSVLIRVCSAVSIMHAVSVYHIDMGHIVNGIATTIVKVKLVLMDNAHMAV